MKAIHQFVAGFSYNDAITNEAMLFRDLFRSWGYESEIYCPLKYVLPELQHEIRDVGDWDMNKKDDQIAFLHLSIGSASNRVVADSACKKAILYHNVTPPEFFRGLQEQIARHLADGRDQVRDLAGVADVVMADSHFNAQELRELGYGDVTVLPLVLDLSGCDQNQIGQS